MALILNEEQNMLKDAAKAFLADRAPVAELRRLRDTNDATGFSPEVWKDMADMGWAGIAVSEDNGGLGFGYVGAGILCEEMGRNLSASPFMSTAIMATAVLSDTANKSQSEALFPSIVDGSLILALALDEGHLHAPENTAMIAKADGDSFVLSGQKSFVVDGHVADKFIVAARTSGAAGDTDGLTLFLVDSDASGVLCERVINLDHHNSANVEFNNVTVSKDNVLGEVDGGFAPLTHALDKARICLAAEMLGVAEEAFERTLEYLKERKQFGEAIGTYQALQHRAAHLYSEIELTRSVVLKALQTIDAGAEDLTLLASIAKAKACATVNEATLEAVQMHGGMGMTDEFDIGFFLKRSRVLQELLGDHRYHADRYARVSGF